MDAFCRKLPKVELHIHLEGALEPALVLKIAKRNGLLDALPDEATFHGKYASFVGLLEFLEVYYAGAGVLRTREDFFEMTLSYALRAASDGVVHAEPFIDLEAHLDLGVPIETVIGGIHDALAKAKSELGMTSGLIVCFQRPRGAAHALTVLEQLKPFIASGQVVGIGTDSDYVAGWPQQYAPVYAKARELGLKLVAHAGEVADGELSLVQMREAVELLGVDRVDHGVRAADDPALLGLVALKGTTLTSCPLSNIRLGLYPAWPQCAAAYAKLIEGGAAVTINSDDPAFFGSIGDNFAQLQQHCGFSAAQMAALSTTAAKACFASAERKAELCALIDAFVAANPVAA